MSKPDVVIVAMLVLGAACAVAGTWLLAGMAWALITAAVILFGVAGAALRGVHG